MYIMTFLENVVMLGFVVVIFVMGLGICGILICFIRRKHRINNAKDKILCIVSAIMLVLSAGTLIYANVTRFKDKKITENFNINYEAQKLLCISGSWEATYYGVDIKDVTYEHRGEALINIFYYNYFNEDDLLYEDLVAQYENFTNGKIESTYSDLKKFVDYTGPKMISIDSNKHPVELISVLDFREACMEYLPEDSWKDDQFTDEKIYEVCNAVIENRESVLSRNVANDFNKEIDENNFYHLLENQFSQEVKCLDNGEQIINREGVKYYLREEKLDYITGETQFCIYKIELDKFSPNYFLYGYLGWSKEKNIEYIGYSKAFIDKGFEVTVDTEDEYVYEMSCMKLTYKYENNECIGIVLELK